MDIRRVPPILEVTIGEGKLTDEWRRRQLEKAGFIAEEDGDLLMQDLIDEEMQKLKKKTPPRPIISAKMPNNTNRTDGETPP